MLLFCKPRKTSWWKWKEPWFVCWRTTSSAWLGWTGSRANYIGKRSLILLSSFHVILRMNDMFVFRRQPWGLFFLVTNVDTFATLFCLLRLAGRHSQMGCVMVRNGPARFESLVSQLVQYPCFRQCTCDEFIMKGKHFYISFAWNSKLGWQQSYPRPISHPKRSITKITKILKWNAKKYHHREEIARSCLLLLTLSTFLDSTVRDATSVGMQTSWMVLAILYASRVTY